MEFSKDFADIHSLLNNVHKSVGDFTKINHLSGNEHKISRVIEELQQLLNRKKIFRDGKINHKNDLRIRKIVLLFIINTELTNKSLIINNKIAHLLNIIPQFSKCLLLNVVFQLDLCQYYGEAISSFPAQISSELLGNCSTYIKRSDPYVIIKQTSTIAFAIYLKAYNMRYENDSDNQILHYVKRFNDILKNYITPVTGEILTWSTDKMYQYMGWTILEILTLTKNCLNLFSMTEYVSPFHQFYQVSQESSHVVIDSPSILQRSNKLLIELNKQLYSVCRDNIQVTVDIFCSWTECTIDDMTLQEAIAYVSYEILQIIKDVNDAEDLPDMLRAIARKPQTIHDRIKSADKSTIIEKVEVKDEFQNIWYKALIRSGIFESEKIYNIFKSLIDLSDNDDYVYLLSLTPEIEYESDFKEFMLQNIKKIPPGDSVKIITEYFVDNGINNLYSTESFDTQVREFLNKLKNGSTDQIPYNEICVLVLQNPIKFINSLLEDCDKSIDHSTNILHILNYIRSICNLKCNDKEHTVFHEMVLNKLKHGKIEIDSENCVISLINQAISHNLLANIIFDQLLDIIENSIENLEFGNAAFICRLYKTLPVSSISHDNYTPFVLKLGYLLKKVRWNFFTYSEEKVLIASEIISLIHHFKTFPEENIIEGNGKDIQELLEDKFDSFHIFQSQSNNFLNYVSEGFDANGNHHEQITRLINLLPRCCPLEWKLVTNNLVQSKTRISALQLYIDVMLILSEMSKKSSSSQDSLSYCFQQFCIVIKDILLTANKDTDLEKAFIKNICRLIKHLPESLQNTIEISLVNLFNLEVLKSLKNDEDFVYSLVSISHLNICKIICSQMT